MGHRIWYRPSKAAGLPGRYALHAATPPLRCAMSAFAAGMSSLRPVTEPAIALELAITPDGAVGTVVEVPPPPQETVPAAPPRAGPRPIHRRPPQRLTQRPPRRRTTDARSPSSLAEHSPSSALQCPNIGPVQRTGAGEHPFRLTRGVDDAKRDSDLALGSRSSRHQSALPQKRHHALEGSGPTEDVEMPSPGVEGASHSIRHRLVAAEACGGKVWGHVLIGHHLQLYRETTSGAFRQAGSERPRTEFPLPDARA